MIRIPFILLSIFLTSCALLGTSSFDKGVVVSDGFLKKYELLVIGKEPNMVHDASQMFWPTYHDVYYKIHVDKLFGEITEENFKLTYKDKLDNLESYSGKLVFDGDKLIINLTTCPRPNNCFSAIFNGSYSLKIKYNK